MQAVAFTPAQVICAGGDQIGPPEWLVWTVCWRKFNICLVTSQAAAVMVHATVDTAQVCSHVCTPYCIYSQQQRS